MAKRGSQRRPSGVGNTKSSDKRPTGREVIGFVEKFLRIPDGPRSEREAKVDCGCSFSSLIGPNFRGAKTPSHRLYG